MLFSSVQGQNVSQIPGTMKGTEKWKSTSGTFMFAAAQILGHCIVVISLYHEIRIKICYFFFGVLMVQQREEYAYISEIIIKLQIIQGRSCVAGLLCRLQVAYAAHWVASFSIQPRSPFLQCDVLSVFRSGIGN